MKKRNYEAQSKGTLSGVRVLDLSRLFAGNLLTQILGDFGAEIIKVEPPSGDTLRAWRTNGVSTHWKIYARNKKSLGLELREPKARELLLRFIPTTNIFIESFRPGMLEKMGLAPELLLQHNPKLIIIRISGWGQTGPYSRRPGFGTLIEAISGFASMNGFPDRAPVVPPTYLADGVAGLYGATAAMIALREVEKNGGAGQVIDVSLLDPLFSIIGPHAANYQLTGKVKPRTGSRSTNSGPRNVYKCKDDKYVALSASTEKMAKQLFRAIGREDLVDDPRFRTNADRVKHSDELDSIVEKYIVQRTQAENVSFFEQAEVTIGPVYDISQLVEDPHMIERELIAEYPDSEMGTLPMHHVVPRFQGTPASIRTPAPLVGEHNRELLKELGIEHDVYKELLASGVLAEGNPPGRADQE